MHVQVRAAALAALVDATQLAGPELRTSALLPLLRRHMQVRVVVH